MFDSDDVNFSYRENSLGQCLYCSLPRWNRGCPSRGYFEGVKPKNHLWRSGWTLGGTPSHKCCTGQHCRKYLWVCGDNKEGTAPVTWIQWNIHGASCLSELELALVWGSHQLGATLLAVSLAPNSCPCSLLARGPGVSVDTKRGKEKPRKLKGSIYL